jgi:hypothetical protein
MMKKIGASLVVFGFFFPAPSAAQIIGAAAEGAGGRRMVIGDLPSAAPIIAPSVTLSPGSWGVLPLPSSALLSETPAAVSAAAASAWAPGVEATVPAAAASVAAIAAQEAKPEVAIAAPSRNAVARAAAQFMARPTASAQDFLVGFDGGGVAAQRVVPESPPVVSGAARSQRLFLHSRATRSAAGILATIGAAVNTAIAQTSIANATGQSPAQSQAVPLITFFALAIIFGAFGFAALLRRPGDKAAGKGSAPAQSGLPAAQKPAEQEDPRKDLTTRINASAMSPEAKEEALKEVRWMTNSAAGNDHAANAKRVEYVERLLALPWGKRTQDRLDLKEARKMLDADHFGLEKVKDAVIQDLAVRINSGSLKGRILCFLGPAGVGKTSIAQDIAKATNRKFVKIQAGGLNDVTDIRGFNRTYLGSMPGSVMEGMKKAGSMNPLMLIDEIDKSDGGEKGRAGVKAALLGLLDPEQNNAFKDNYFGVDFDMSEVFFIVTANHRDMIPAELADRLEIIEFQSYMTSEKVAIADRYTIPKKLKETGLLGKGIEVTRNAIERIINGYTMEAGVRDLEREIKRLFSVVVKRLLDNGEAVPARIDAADVEKYLGPAPYRERATADNGVGVVTGMFVTDKGGGVANFIVEIFKGTGKLITRKTFKNMTDDSAQNVLVAIRSMAERLKIDPEIFAKIDIDISISPATEADGPSAGVTMATALASRLTGRPVRKGIAMTGELTTDGRVLPIGGLRDKILGAYRQGYKTIIYPAANEHDALEVPEEVRSQMELVPVERFQQVLDRALDDEVTAPPVLGAAAPELSLPDVLEQLSRVLSRFPESSPAAKAPTAARS